MPIQDALNTGDIEDDNPPPLQYLRDDSKKKYNKLLNYTNSHSIEFQSDPLSQVFMVCTRGIFFKKHVHAKRKKKKSILKIKYQNFRVNYIDDVLQFSIYLTCFQM